MTDSENITIDTVRPRFWRLRKPFATTAEGWEDWTRIARENFPVRYWFQEELFFRISCWWSRLRDVKWWFKYRLHPKHRYNVVKLDLKPGYYDTDTRILYAVFTLFDEFMRHQHSDKCFVDWTCEEHIEEWTEMNEIWEWWKARETREERFEQEHPYPELPEDWGMLSVINARYDDDQRMIEYKEVMDLHTQQEIEWNREDEEMLVRVMRIRLRLWD